jgi:hypothetical protein
MEQEPAYVDVVVRRWEEYTGRKAGCIPAGDEEARQAPGSEVVA